MSLISSNLYKLIKEIFPLNTIVKEHYVNYKGTKLFFDFYIKDLGVLVECQGQQHLRFVKHFHDDRDGFVAQKKRDNMKLEYAKENNTVFIRVYFDENITKELILDKISKGFDECLECE